MPLLTDFAEIMGLEKLAYNNLAKRHPKLRRNGLSAFLHELAEKDSAAEELIEQPSWIGFIPDAIEPDFDEEILRIYEIEDTSKLTEAKIHRIENFGHTLYDYTEWYCELWVVDRYGVDEKMIWTVKDGITWTYLPTGELLTVTEIEERERKKQDRDDS